MPKTTKIIVAVGETRSIGFQALRFELSEEIEVEEGDDVRAVKRETTERLARSVSAYLTNEEPRLRQVAWDAQRYKELL